MTEEETKEFVLKYDDIRKFYRSYRWRVFRKQVMQRKKYRCEKCWAEGKYKKATVLHHIKHLRQYPELAMTESNLMALCTACHRKEHPDSYKNFKYKKFKFNRERWD